MASILISDSHKPSEAMFNNKDLSELYADAIYFYETNVVVKDKLNWFQNDDKWHPIIHKSDCFQGIKRTYAFYILSQKADGELASKAALEWASRVKNIDKTEKIEKKAMFEYAKKAFIKLNNTYFYQYGRSSNQSDYNAADNYRKASEIMGKILTLDSAVFEPFEKMADALEGEG